MVSNIIYAAETPFGAGNDWTIFVVAPSGGAAQLSFDGGSTWITSPNYNNDFGAFELKCQDGYGSQWGSGGCSPINGTGTLVVRARKQGDIVSKLFTIGQGEQVQGGDGFSYSYSAYCEGQNIHFTLAAQYAEVGENNYQLTQEDTQKIQVSVNGQFLSSQGEYSDGCFVDTCHWVKIFQKVTVPASSFPLNVVMSDSSSVVDQWSDSIAAGDIGNPCSAAVTPVAPVIPVSSAVNDTFSVLTSQTLSGNVSLNDTPCSSGTTSFIVTENPLQGQVTMLSNGTFTYSPREGFVGQDSFRYGIFCNGQLSSQARAIINITTNDPCFGQSSNPDWIDTGIKECVDGLKMAKFRNMNPCYNGDDYEWRILGKCGKCKKKCKEPCKKPEPDCGCGK